MLWSDYVVLDEITLLLEFASRQQCQLKNFPRHTCTRVRGLHLSRIASDCVWIAQFCSDRDGKQAYVLHKCVSTKVVFIVIVVVVILKETQVVNSTRALHATPSFPHSSNHSKHISRRLHYMFRQFFYSFTILRRSVWRSLIENGVNLAAKEKTNNNNNNKMHHHYMHSIKRLDLYFNMQLEPSEKLSFLCPVFFFFIFIVCSFLLRQN